jgi:transposase
VNSRKSKRSALQELRAWNAHPGKVKAPLFASHPFFDPEDKAQVKYEMLRRREAETAPLEVTCHEFGFTRESYRHILGRFRSEGMGGLFELKRGRRNPLKANDEVRGLLSNAHAQDPSLGPDQLARHCQETIGVTLSRRTVYRVLADESERKKKRRTNKLRSRRG